MKLSKAQQTVIDMMREGWRMKTYCILHPGCNFSTGVGKATFRSLIKREIIKFNAQSGYYELTEQYKTTNNENSNT